MSAARRSALARCEAWRRRCSRTRWARRLRSRWPFEPKPVTAPIFMVGTVRSGTTFLARMLGSHPQVLYAGFELLAEWSEIAGIEIAGPGLRSAHCPRADGAALADGEILAIRRRFARLHADKGGWRGTRLFNKNPHLWNKLALVERLFPDARFIVTSRDLPSTVASTKRLWEKMHRDWGIHHYLPEDPTACWSCSPPLDLSGLDRRRAFPGGDVTVLAEYWLRVYRTLDAELPEDRQVLLSHAHFVASPQTEIAKTLESLRLSPYDVELPAPVQRGRNRRWRSILDPPEIAAVERYMDRFGDAIAGLRVAGRPAEEA